MASVCVCGLCIAMVAYVSAASALRGTHLFRVSVLFDSSCVVKLGDGSVVVIGAVVVANGRFLCTACAVLSEL